MILTPYGYPHMYSHMLLESCGTMIDLESLRWAGGDVWWWGGVDGVFSVLVVALVLEFELAVGKVIVIG